MGLLEEVLRMKQSGMTEDQIIPKLQEQGNTYKAISEAISQSRIKQAIEEPEPNENPSVAPSPDYNQEEQQIQQPLPPAPQAEQQYPQSYPQQDYSQNYNQPQTDYPQQQNYDYSQASSLSSDTIMEISEQIISEKLSDVRKKLEKISSFKTELETKTESIEERLKRIEQIIDALQTSVLRKVGDYVTNVEDIKHELIETQKTFAKVLGSKHHKEHKN